MCKKGRKSNKGSMLEAGERRGKMRTVKINLARHFNEKKKPQMFSSHKHGEGKSVVVQ